jgi:hypothetical protein
MRKRIREKLLELEAGTSIGSDSLRSRRYDPIGQMTSDYSDRKHPTVEI